MTTNDVKKKIKLYQQNILKNKHRPNTIETDMELHWHNFPSKAQKHAKIKKMLNVLLIIYGIYVSHLCKNKPNRCV